MATIRSGFSIDGTRLFCVEIEGGVEDSKSSHDGSDFRKATTFMRPWWYLKGFA